MSTAAGTGIATRTVDLKARIAAHDARIDAIDNSVKSLEITVGRLSTSVEHGFEAMRVQLTASSRTNWSAIGVAASIVIPMLLAFGAFAWYPITLSQSHYDAELARLRASDDISLADRRAIERDMARWLERADALRERVRDLETARTRETESKK